VDVRSASEYASGHLPGAVNRSVALARGKHVACRVTKVTAANGMKAYADQHGGLP